MTIQNTTIRKAGPSQGNGVTTVFPFTFKVFTATDILVTYLDASGVESVLVLSTNYTVSLNADQNASPGGSVTLLVAPATATYITLTSQVTNTQNLNLTNSGGFYPQSINDALDRTVIEIQQLAEKVSRTVSIPTSSTASVTLPIPAANNVLVWNNTATALINLPATAGTSLVDLAASTGSTLVGTTNGGTGSVTRTVASKLNDSVAAKDFGVVGDGVTNDSTALANAVASALTKQKVVTLSGTVNAPSMTLANYIDTNFEGNFETLTNVYRKKAIPEFAPSDSLQCIDIVPDKHLQQLNAVTKPVVVLVGDSISTYLANSNARGDLLSNVLHKTLDKQFPQGITFYDRAIGGKAWSSLSSSQYQTYIPWYAGNVATTWIEMVHNLNPDLVVFSFGMNDSSGISVNAMKTAIDTLQSWAKVPSIVIASNLVPSPASASFPDTGSGQEGRDIAAGLNRSYAKYRNVGLLDIHRKYCMVRDGYDPLSTVQTTGDAVYPIISSGGQYVCTGTKQVTEFKANINFNGTPLVANTQTIVVQLGAGANDFVQIYYNYVAGNLTVVGYYGSASDYVAYAGTNAVFSMPSTSGGWLSVEKIGDYLVIYNETDSQFGSYNEPLFMMKIVTMGGTFYPKIYSSGDALNAVTYWYGVNRVNKPSATNSLLWGNDPVPSGGNIYGGSGFNHPSGLMAALVYRPMIESILWCKSSSLISTNNNLVGYGTGSGGTVTQLTSKSTNVTLNKACGVITMSNAALGAGGVVSFYLNNSTIINNVQNFLLTPSLINAYNYSFRTYCGNGQAYIIVKNETAGSLSDAIILNFAVIQGASS